MFVSTEVTNSSDSGIAFWTLYKLRWFMHITLQQAKKSTIEIIQYTRVKRQHIRTPRTAKLHQKLR